MAVSWDAEGRPMLVPVAPCISRQEAVDLTEELGWYSKDLLRIIVSELRAVDVKTELGLCYTGSLGGALYYPRPFRKCPS